MASVGSMVDLTPAGRQLIDDLVFTSQVFAVETDTDARKLLARKAQRTMAMAMHPIGGRVCHEILSEAISPELAIAIRELATRPSKGGDK